MWNLLRYSGPMLCFSTSYFTFIGTRKNRTGLPKVMGIRPRRHPCGSPLIAAAERNRSTVFARWRQCARPSKTRFARPTPLTNPNGSSIGSAVFFSVWPMLHSSYTLRCADPFPPNLSVTVEGILNPGSFGPPDPELQTAPRRVGRFSRYTHAHYQRTDRQNDDQTQPA